MYRKPPPDETGFPEAGSPEDRRANDPGALFESLLIACDEAIHRGEALPAATLDAAALVAALAEGVAHTHARGIVHRDIKPANVLLAPASAASPGVASLAGEFVTPCLTDFGLARLSDSDASDATLRGFLGGVRSLSFHPTCMLLAAAGDAPDSRGQIRLWSAEAEDHWPRLDPAERGRRAAGDARSCRLIPGD